MKIAPLKKSTKPPPKRKNIGYAICKPRIGKWTRKGKIKSRCSDQMVSYSTVAPPKEVMAMYSDKDFQPL